MVSQTGCSVPARGRDSVSCWGLEDNSVDEQQEEDGDSILLLRLMFLQHLALISNQLGGSLPEESFLNILQTLPHIHKKKWPNSAHLFGPCP